MSDDLEMNWKTQVKKAVARGLKAEGRVKELEAELDNLRSYLDHTKSINKWYLDGEITWQEYAESQEVEVKRLKEEIKMLKLLHPEPHSHELIDEPYWESERP